MSGRTFVIDEQMLNFCMRHVAENICLRHHQGLGREADLGLVCAHIDEVEDALQLLPALLASGDMPVGYVKLQALADSK